MFDRVLAGIALGILDYLARRIERGHVAVDADLDVDRLRRAGDRINEWLLANGAGRGGKPDKDWPPSVDQGLRSD
jgi:hypothetical protein